MGPRDRRRDSGRRGLLGALRRGGAALDALPGRGVQRRGRLRGPYGLRAPVAKEIGWETNGFQYEVAFASLGVGLAAIYASTVDDPSAWVVGSIGAGVFLLLAGVNHIVEIFRDRNYAPGNTVILVSDLGVPISLFALLLATGAL